MKTYGRVDVPIHVLSTSAQVEVVSFTPRSLYPRYSLDIRRREGGGGRAHQSDMKSGKFLTLPRLELRPLSRPASSTSLYLLSWVVRQKSTDVSDEHTASIFHVYTRNANKSGCLSSQSSLLRTETKKFLSTCTSPTPLCCLFVSSFLLLRTCIAILWQIWMLHFV
jgi:hypothetical protein